MRLYGGKRECTMFRVCTGWNGDSMADEMKAGAYIVVFIGLYRLTWVVSKNRGGS